MKYQCTDLVGSWTY